MTGNSIGKIFRVTTFGESHGKSLGCIIDGVPPGMKISEKDLRIDLDRRRPSENEDGISRRNEPDRVEILSGIFNGFTTGNPIGIILNNCDKRSQDYDNIREIFRPGHADYTYQKKYGVRDHRGGGRSSARETAMWVAAGSIAKKYLRQNLGITIQAYLSQVGNMFIDFKEPSCLSRKNFFCPDSSKILELKKLFSHLKKIGDSVGSKVTVFAKHMFPGLGEPVFHKLNADISYAMMNINGVKAVEIGDGFNVVQMNGSYHRDEIRKGGTFRTNHSGGILGGITTGQDVVVHIAFKPSSSIKVPCTSINHDGEEVTISVSGRHDVCIGIRAVPVVEAMLAIVLIDHFLMHKGRCMR
ncbi:chorismate synthase [Candidatus Riesia pediculischaeffi]|uniref:Chorismate synthase n=1 Tax=Candidatus Riesia pediculischaeffi TaxID=428411 RepID=A0A1V0HK19_9ENTR|nr:chorismate synthase [Candidatus Riesia pediculischaeffi]ARC53173.1 chorismate synthase [Candidatus Riesia pediculischaeffi]